MKTKILITSVVVLTMLSSCGSSHCNINKWRCRRYVQSERPIEKPPIVKHNV